MPETPSAPLDRAFRTIMRDELEPVEKRILGKLEDVRTEHGKLIAENSCAIGDLTRAIKKLTVALGNEKAARRSGGPNLASGKMAAKSR